MKYRFRRSKFEVTSGEFNVPWSDVLMKILHENESLNNIIYYLDQQMLSVLAVMSLSSSIPTCFELHFYTVHTYILTYLLTPRCRVLLEKLTGLQLVKKFLAFHGTPMFITALTSVRQLSVSWASPIQSIYPHPSSWRSILILSTHLRLGLPNGLFIQCILNHKCLL